MAQLNDTSVNGSLAVTGNLIIGSSEINVEDKLSQTSIEFTANSVSGFSNKDTKVYKYGNMLVAQIGYATSATVSAWQTVFTLQLSGYQVINNAPKHNGSFYFTNDTSGNIVISTNRSIASNSTTQFVQLTTFLEEV